MTGSAIARTRSLLCLVAFALLAALPARAETLADALIAAYRNSNLLDQNRAVLRAADEDVAAAVSALRPTLQFITASQYAFSEQRSPLSGQRVSADDLTTTVSLSGQITLFDFGRNQFAIEAAKEIVLATREALVSVEQNVLLAVVSAYVNVRLGQEIVSLRQNNVRVIGEQLRAAEDRFEVGEVTRTDVAQAQARLAAARANLVSAQGDLAIARENYRAATGAYPGALAPLPAPPRTAASLDEAQAIALRTQPSIRQLQRQVAAAELNVRRAEAETRPSIDGTARLSVDDEGFQTNSVGIQMSQTIYAGGRLAALQRRAMANRDATRGSLQQEAVIVSETVGTVWANVQVAGATVTATEEQISAAQIAFEGVREEASLGARTTLDVLDAEQDLLDARAARLTAEADRYVGVYRLLSALGLLTVEHLGLGVPTYDPAAYYNAVRTAPAHSPQGRKLDRIMRAIGEN